MVSAYDFITAEDVLTEDGLEKGERVPMVIFYPNLLLDFSGS